MIALKKNGRKRKRDRRGRERALVLAATKLFAAQGYDTTTTREIAASAGCAEGLIHRYFGGKAGLLAGLVRDRLSQDVADLTGKLPPAPEFEDEVFQLVRWEVERVWGDRDFLRVIIPRMLTDSDLAKALGRLTPETLHTKAILERLQRHSGSRGMPAADVEALAQLIGAVGFVFGFMRPVVMRHNREHSRETANTIARILVPGFASGSYPAAAV
jgi:AcrR family transcriptional regulator